MHQAAIKRGMEMRASNKFENKLDDNFGRNLQL